MMRSPLLPLPGERWVPRRKAMVLAALRETEITVEEVCRFYSLSRDELGRILRVSRRPGAARNAGSAVSPAAFVRREPGRQHEAIADMTGQAPMNIELVVRFSAPRGGNVSGVARRIAGAPWQLLP